MEEIYIALLLHRLGKEINEGNVKKVLEAAGAKVDQAKIKAVVAALDGVNIEDAIKEAASVAPIATPSTGAKVSEKKEEKQVEEEKKSEEAAASGLASLFG